MRRVRVYKYKFLWTGRVDTDKGREAEIGHGDAMLSSNSPPCELRVRRRLPGHPSTGAVLEYSVSAWNGALCRRGFLFATTHDHQYFQQTQRKAFSILQYSPSGDYGRQLHFSTLSLSTLGVRRPRPIRLIAEAWSCSLLVTCVQPGQRQPSKQCGPFRDTVYIPRYL